MISENITYKEAIRSTAAERFGLDNIPTETEIANMKMLAQYIFEPLRAHFNDKPIFITSFFRSEEVNKKVGGSRTSDHRFGKAIDLDDIYGGATNKEMFDYVRNNLEFKQLIWEFGNDKQPAWVHISYDPGNNKKEVLRAIRFTDRAGREKTKYIPYENIGL